MHPHPASVAADVATGPPEEGRRQDRGWPINRRWPPKVGCPRGSGG
jgi:hypothetical protein